MKEIKDRNNKNKKFNLTFKRIVSRLSFTFILGILFGFAMMPFLQTGEGLYDMQQAAIGQQNMLRMVALWGLFTLIVSILAFWRKRFRMVAVLLVCCWIISIVFLLLINSLGGKDYYCKRISMYPMPSEFNRSLDLIAQRIRITDKVGYWIDIPFQYKNCLNIQYSDSLGDAEGMFIPDDASNLQNFPIYLKTEYKSFDDLTIATILVHELSHVGGYIQGYVNKETKDCFEQEINAFGNQAIFLFKLNSEERRSIFTRIKDNVNLNPAFQVLLLIDQRGLETYSACTKIRESNLLTDEQFYKCFDDGIINKIAKDVRDNPYYQEQCADY